MDEDTEVYYSCSAQLNGELFVFGGNNGDKRKQVLIELSHLYYTCYHQLQVSKVIGCGLKRIGDLNYDFQYGACGTFSFPQERIMLCFGYSSVRKCERYPLQTFCNLKFFKLRRFGFSKPCKFKE